MSEETHQTETPEDIVAEQITAALKEAGLVVEDRSEEFRTLLAAGQVKGEDWSFEIDLATAPKEEIDEQ